MLKKLINLSFPVLIALYSQYFIGLVDAAMVSRLGSGPLGTLGLCQMFIFIAQSFVLGFGPTTQFVTSNLKNKQRALSSIILFSILIGLIISGFFIFFANDILNLSTNDPVFTKNAINYYRVRLLGIIPIGLMEVFAGYYLANKKPFFNLKIIMSMQLLNIFFNWIFIFGNLGVNSLGLVGAAWGSTLALSMAALFHIFWVSRLNLIAFFKNGFNQFIFIKKIVLLSLPICGQQLLFAGCFALFFTFIARKSREDLAIATVLIQVILLFLTPSVAMGHAFLSLLRERINQVSPMNDYKDFYQVLMKLFFAFIFMSGILLITKDILLSIFFSSSETVNRAVIPFILISFAIAIDSLGMIFSYCLIALGNVVFLFSTSTFLQWAVFLPLIYLVYIKYDYPFVSLWIILGGYRLLQTLLFGAKLYFSHKKLKGIIYV
jgi:putative MATE family efflux protein